MTEYLQSSKRELHFLPPYSPNLKLIERLWKWMKERMIYNTYYREFEDFKLATFGFFAALSSLNADPVLSQDLTLFCYPKLALKTLQRDKMRKFYFLFVCFR